MCVCGWLGMSKLPKTSLLFLCNMSDKVDFLLTDKCESFLEIDTMNFDVDYQASPKFPKCQVYNAFTAPQ